ncbi:MAG: pilus assembly protein PilP [Syntrophobacteria bacterium]
MKDKRSIVLIVILLALIGVYVWYSQKTKVTRPAQSKAVDVAKVDPNQALARKLTKGINAYKKDKGSVPKNLQELKGKYVEPEIVDEARAKKFEYTYVNAQSYRIGLPKAGASTKVAAAKKVPEKPTSKEPSPEAGSDTSSPEVVTTETGWKYDPKGKPNPFKPFIAARKAATSAPSPRERVGPLTPLEKMSLSEIQKGLKAIVWGKMGTKALVEDGTGKGYVIEEGSYVGQNEGIVKKIFEDKIIVEEYVRRPLDNRLVTNEVVLELKKIKGED